MPSTSMGAVRQPESTVIGIDLGARHARFVTLRNGSLRSGKMLSTYYARNGNIGLGHLNVAPTDYISDACQSHPSQPLQLGSARWQADIDPVSCIYNPSTGLQLSQKSVVTAVLRQLLARAEVKEPSAAKALIAVPSYSTNAYRKMVTEAAREAGLASSTLLNQSTAAVMAYRLENCQPAPSSSFKRRVLGVVSVGAASFEASIYSIAPGGAVRLLVTRGSVRLGGRTITDEMTVKALEQIRATYKQKNECDKHTFAKEYVKQVWHACEAAKEALADVPNTMLDVSVYDEHYEYPLDQTDLDALCSVQEMVALIRDVLNSNHASLLDEVLLVGGASRLPQLTAIIKSLMPAHCKFVTNVAPLEAVLTGVGITAFAGIQHDHPDDFAFVPDMCYQGVRAQIEDQLVVPLVRMGDVLPIVADCPLKLWRTRAKKFEKKLVVSFESHSSSTAIDGTCSGEEIASIDLTPPAVRNQLEPAAAVVGLEVSISVDASGIVSTEPKWASKKPLLSTPTPATAIRQGAGHLDVIEIEEEEDEVITLADDASPAVAKMTNTPPVSHALSSSRKRRQSGSSPTSMGNTTGERADGGKKLREEGKLPPTPPQTPATAYQATYRELRENYGKSRDSQPRPYRACRGMSEAIKISLSDYSTRVSKLKHLPEKDRHSFVNFCKNLHAFDYSADTCESALKERYSRLTKVNNASALKSLVDEVSTEVFQTVDKENRRGLRGVKYDFQKEVQQKWETMCNDDYSRLHKAFLKRAREEVDKHPHGKTRQLMLDRIDHIVYKHSL